MLSVVKEILEIGMEEVTGDGVSTQGLRSCWDERRN